MTYIDINNDNFNQFLTPDSFQNLEPNSTIKLNQWKVPTQQIIQVLLNALSNGKFSFGTTLILSYLSLNTNEIVAFARGIKSPCCPLNFTLDLSNNTRGGRNEENSFAHETVEFANALTSGLCKPGLTLILGSNQISTSGVNALALSVSSGKCPPGLTLDLSCQSHGFLFYTGALIRAIGHSNCPINFGLNISGTYYNFDSDYGDWFYSAKSYHQTLCEEFAKLIRNRKYPQGLDINLGILSSGISVLDALRELPISELLKFRRIIAGSGTITSEISKIIEDAKQYQILSSPYGGTIFGEQDGRSRIEWLESYQRQDMTKQFKIFSS